MDAYPESAFFNVGTIDDVIAKANAEAGRIGAWALWNTFGLKIIASDRVFYEGRCRKLVIPAPDGEKGILPNHENMVIAVKIGMARMEIEEGNW